MINGKTVFVVGAGASEEAGLPIGSKLAQSVAALLDIKFKHGWEQFSGSYEISAALRAFANSSGSNDINPYLYAGWAIRDAAPLVLSIDNFIDAHREDKSIELCGKLAISQAILGAEQNSKLHFDQNSRERLDASQLAGTWYIKLLQLLTEGVDRSQLSKIFENVTFIVFNYDRCLEHFLAEALAAYYRANIDEMRRVVAAAKFIHPYGTVGGLAWFGSLGPSFGADVGGEKLLQIAGGLKTFTEQFTDEVMQTDLQTAIERARTLVFLGFAFHEQNMKLLALKQRGDAKRVFATAYAVSTSDCQVITANILETLRTKRTHTSVEIRNDLKCVGLFDQYWRSLRAS